MIITKYKHACFTVELNNEVLVVDPGVFSDDFVPSANITSIVITHEHADHFDPDQLADIFAVNPEAVVISTQAIVNKVSTRPNRAVQPGDKIEIGAFTLQFFGGEHAVIHSSLPIIANLGVLINHTLYYPGDSFSLPDQAIDTLAIPAAAPWAKVGEVIDFLLEVKPRFAFPTHDAILSETGQAMTDQMLSNKAQAAGITYRRIDDQPLEVA
jgi:L-ascorbate metabolism protein UlaG (beta-lactamase superfamily)